MSKRKLDAGDIPTESSPTECSPDSSGSSTFEGLQLDSRLLQALSKSNFTRPTPVQAQAIPLALAGRDILARARTGSGKTAAYILPVLQLILHTKATSPLAPKVTRCLVIVPTRELADQVHQAFESFSSNCAKQIRSVNISQHLSNDVVRSLLADGPEVVIATPGRATQSLSLGSLSFSSLAHLVIDEADLVLSYGYEDDLNVLSKSLPPGVQTFLMSATLNPEVDTIKTLFCANPAVMVLEDKQDDANGLSQYVVRCAEDEKFLLLYVIFKLQLVDGKCIIFVNDVDRSYRLKLFLDQFGVKSCILNPELPVNSRIHVVQEFNKGVYRNIIAADDQELLSGTTSTGNLADTNDAMPEDDHEENENEQEENKEETSKRRRKISTKQKEFGVSRGIDFQDVVCVMNFDLPSSAKAYAHRIGRTARAGKSGMALSFVIPVENFNKHKTLSTPSARHDEKVLARIVERQAKQGKEVKPYHFDMKHVDAFRYRMDDALRATTHNAVRQARSRELKQELMKSEKLRNHFAANPSDLRHLRHDGVTRAARVQPHLRHVPDYLMPPKGKRSLTSEEADFVPLHKKGSHKHNKSREQRRFTGKKPGRASGKNDPLRSFNIKRK